MRLSLASLGQVSSAVRLPAYDVRGLKPGILHLGLGAFHRAHQAVFTEDAIEAAGGDWGIIGVSMRRPDVADSLSPQDGLFTVETLGAVPAYRVIGALRAALTLPAQPAAVLSAIAAASTHLITLTITEKGYALAGDDLDLNHPDVAHDLAGSGAPRSAIGALVAGLARRTRQGAGPITIVSCDNLSANGPRLEAAVRTFADRVAPNLPRWLDANASFPETMVDCIVPASDAASRARMDAALGLSDEASVQREPFAQWVIEDRFVAPRPRWGEGVELVGQVADHRRLKLHVLNAAHSALAYLGLRRGHTFVREAIADPELASRLDTMIEREIAPALGELPVRAYWQSTRRRFANPMIDHRLDQIAQDGAAKLAERLYPLMHANLAAGRPIGCMAEVVRAWLDSMRAGAPLQSSVDDPGLFPASFHADPRLGAALAEARP